MAMKDRNPPRALIADDESILAQALQRELHAQWPDLEIIGIARDGDEAIERLFRERPDIAFLDIRMPGSSGLEVAQAVAEDWQGEDAPLIVFVTAHGEFALDAFEQAAVDFLTKPVRAERLARTVVRLQQRLASSDRQSVQTLAEQVHRLLGERERSNPLQWIRAGVGDSVRLIPIDDVVFFEAADKYVLVATQDADALIRESLRTLLPRLDSERFVQTSRSLIVNLHCVQAAERGDDTRVRLRLRGRPERPVVSRVFAHLFRAM